MNFIFVCSDKTDVINRKITQSRIVHLVATKESRTAICGELLECDRPKLIPSNERDIRYRICENCEDTATN